MVVASARILFNGSRKTVAAAMRASELSSMQGEKPYIWLSSSLHCTTTGIVQTIAISKCNEVCYLLRLQSSLDTLRGFIEEMMKNNILGVVTGRNASNHILLMKTS